MPYIKPERRKKLDPAIKVVEAALLLHNPDPTAIAGDLNYIITSLLMDTLRVSYSSMALWIGVLETAKLELYRRVIAEYEDEKCSQNGDVYNR